MILTVIVLWLSSNYDLPAEMKHPRVEFVSKDEMTQRRLLTAANTAAPSNEELEAVYLDAARTIYLPKDWSGRSAKDVSVLVHEMVHHLQMAKGERYACAAERERLAYQAQQKWLAQFGKSLESEFGLDPFSLLAKSMCN